VTDRFSVNVDHLNRSATKYRAHAFELTDSHAQVEQRLAAATGGWVGNSAESLYSFAARMVKDIGMLVDRIDLHSDKMNTAANRIDANEEQRASGFTNLTRGGEV